MMSAKHSSFSGMMAQMPVVMSTGQASMQLGYIRWLLHLCALTPCCAAVL